MKQLWRISPSAVASHSGKTGCPRKVALNWVTPCGEETEKQKFGSALHKIQQDYLNLGKAPDRTTKAGKCAMAGLPWMPPPKSGRAEGESEVRISGINYVTIVDYEGPSDLLPGAPPGLPATLDHKTSSNPSQYGLWGHEAMATDPQALTYAARALVKHPQATSVFNRWLYYDTRRASKAEPSDQVLTRDEVVSGFGRLVHPVAVKLIHMQNSCPAEDAGAEVRLAWANTVDSNTDACEAYGGCQHARSGNCRLTAAEKFRASLGGLDAAKIENTKRDPSGSQPGLAPVTEESVMSTANGTDLFAKLTSALPASAKKPSVRPPAVNAAVSPPAAAPVSALAVTGIAVDALAALTGATAKAAPKSPAPAATPDPINPPEKPSVAAPAKGADLMAHLQSVVASGTLPPAQQAQTVAALETAVDKAVVAGLTAAKAVAQTTTETAKAMPKSSSKAESKAKLTEAMAAASVPYEGASDASDAELGRAVRVLVSFLVRAVRG